MGMSYLRRERRATAKGRRGAKVGSGGRLHADGTLALALEQFEERVLLTHAAPVLNSAGTPSFAPIAENLSLAANGGSTVNNMLASGGAGFLTIDTTSANAAPGIAVISQQGEQHGIWQFSTNAGASWNTLSPIVGSAHALVLRGGDSVRFLPDQNFVGTASLQFLGWDQTDGATAGTYQNLSTWGATGGSTAYSNTSASASLAVSSSPPAFTLASSTTTLENNTVAGSGGVPGGSNPNVISVPNFATNISLGVGSSNAVSFTVSDAGGNFATLFAQAPQINSSGTLTYQLKPDVFGTASLSVVASNGVATSAAKTANIFITQINDPPTLNPIANPAPILDNAGVQTISLSGISAGLNEPAQQVSVTVAATPQTGDNGGLISGLTASYTNPSATGSVTYSPISGQNGTLHVTVTATDNGGTLNGGVNTFSQTFVVTVDSPPSFTSPNVRVVQNAGAQSMANWATGVNPGFPGTSGSLSYTITGDTVPGLFAVAPAVDPTGKLTFTPAAGQYGVTTVTLNLHNSYDNLTSTAQSFTIAVVAPPTAYPETYEVNYTGSSSTPDATTGVLANDYDPNPGGVKTAQVNSNPANGILSLNSNGSFTYTSGGTFQGLDRFSYQVSDSPATGNVVTDTIYSHEGALVNKLYQQALNRPADDAAITYNAPLLHNGSMSMYTLAGNVVASTEGKNVAVNRIFLQFLGRAASASDQNTWDPYWSNGPDTVITGVASSNECYTYAGTQNGFGGTSSNTAWVTLLYYQLLNRAPDPGGLNYFLGQLGQGVARQTVVGEFLNTDEHRAVVVAFYFNLYLQRAPSSSDSSYWVGQLRAGMTELAFQQNVVGSGEYAAIPPAPGLNSVYRLTS